MRIHRPQCAPNAPFPACSAAVAKCLWPRMRRLRAASCICVRWSERRTVYALRLPKPAARPVRRKRWAGTLRTCSIRRARALSWKLARRMPDPVVITRPAPQAASLAERLTALGREAVVFPLLDIQPLPDQSALRAALADVSGYALVAFV